MSFPDFKADLDKCKKFLEDFKTDDGDVKYMSMLQDIANRTRKVIDIELDDLLEHTQDDVWVESVRSNVLRYISLFAEAMDALMPDPKQMRTEEDRFDVLHDTRMRNMNRDPQDPNANPAQQLPIQLKRRYEIRLKPQAKQPVSALRHIKAKDIGHLVTVSGIVTKCTDVKPLVSVATYACDNCAFEIYQEVTAPSFQPILECPSVRCKQNAVRGILHLLTRASLFLPFQEVRIQEEARDVPMGHIPRSMAVHVRGQLTRQVSPGDVVIMSGVFLPIPFAGFRQMRAGLVADTYLQVMQITHKKKQYNEYVTSPEVQEEIQKLAEDGDIYSKLSRSIAPEIFGHEDVKKALLLLLVGAPNRTLPDGMKIRGDVHVCLMGDPGVAKSQLLKHITSVAPRGVYTTGRGSSGVGLTAAVTRDTVTNEMVLEGGALVLADMGICAIDEFDKMEESDRTAIHEVMEQQTVSIAKAGITTTLNARTTVLAAANPAWGRYDMRRSPAENINLPPALLSRFDLMWLILDIANHDNDIALAHHVLHVHQKNRAPDLDFVPISGSTLRAYVAISKEYEPTIPPELAEYIATAYSTLRQEELQSEAPHSYTTARTLLSILRLSEALARLRFSATVSQNDVDEALRLMQMSKYSLYAENKKKAGLDPITDCYTIIRDEALRARRQDISYEDALKWVNQKGGHKEDQLKQCLEEYAELNVWQLDPVTLSIHIIDSFN